MAKLDGTGPQGAGPGTGWGRGPCGAGMSRGCGRGFGWRRPMTNQEEKDALKNEAEYLEKELEIVKTQLAEAKD